MKVVVVDKHDGEGRFPAFKAGEAVHNMQACDESVHWKFCTINGFDTYIPEVFVHNGVLARDYDPTEILIEAGEVLEVEAVVYEWLYVKNAVGICGWIPAEKVLSVSVK